MAVLLSFTAAHLEYLEAILAEKAHLLRLLYFFLLVGDAELAECIIAPGKQIALVSHYHHVAHSLIDLLDWLCDLCNPRRQLYISALSTQSAATKGVQRAISPSDKAYPKAG